MAENTRTVRAFDYKTVLLTFGCVAVFCFFGTVMGVSNFCSTVMETAHDLLINTVLLIVSISVLAGGFGAFLSEFGILAMLNWILAPFIRLLWGLPGAAVMGAVSTYMSDNPAVIALANDKEFIRYFKKYQKPALTNFGTSFGMGLVLTAFMMSKGFFREAIIGNVGAVVGSIVSTRIMLAFCKHEFNGNGYHIESDGDPAILRYRQIREGGVLQRAMEAVLEGGKEGLKMGAQIVPGVLVVCTLVLMLTFDAGHNGYDGSAYQGIPVLSKIGALFAKPMQLLFGFESPDAIAFPLTSLGAAGAALSLIPRMLAENLIGPNEIAVFTAMGMCWSGYLSTHVAMMDALGYRKLTLKAILSHTIGGITAGVAAHYIFVLLG
ncbi:hypothetical protein STSP2_00123 [Anaerohalosphaera lusitana]|uniref:Transporter gate domain protein n=1 Tax=Anaerohalosphaera lusitana TaxID=1936003 RepID=A0A1U9NGQ3_9BACT|nr:hypothetical protein [Anaerohalosphaera lusitana]AQT66985.1 hypothetical protein STSP2_00123 [Anaerohalosphaera lusitana]